MHDNWVRLRMGCGGLDLFPVWFLKILVDKAGLKVIFLKSRLNFWTID